MPDTLIIERHGAVTLIQIDRPKRLNAISVQVVDDLATAFAAYDADPTQRCLILTGSDKLFVVGADVNEVRALDFPGAFHWPFFAGFDRLRATRKPWFAAVAGFALGGGCELALLADFILAADTAMFGQPEINLAVIPGAGGTQRLARAVGKAKAMEMCLSARMMTAAEAERAGLVARIVPADQLRANAMATAQTIAAMPPLATLAIKDLIHAALDTTLTQGLALERTLRCGLGAGEGRPGGSAPWTPARD